MGAEYDGMRNMEARMSKLEKVQSDMSDDLIVLKTSMDNNTNALNEFIELGKTFKFGIKILGVIEATAVWITKVALAIGTIWATWKYVVLEAVRQGQK